MPARVRWNPVRLLAVPLTILVLLPGCSYAPEPEPTPSTSPAIEALDRAARQALRSGGSGVTVHARWGGETWE